MSFFGRLFGSVKAADEQRRADALYTERRYYDAKTAYEAASTAADATDAIKRACAERIDACSDGLAQARVTEAEKHLAHGDLALARNPADAVGITTIEPHDRQPIPPNATTPQPNPPMLRGDSDRKATS